MKGLSVLFAFVATLAAAGCDDGGFTPTPKAPCEGPLCPCVSSDQCSSPGERCNEEAGVCVVCVDAGDCPDGQRCAGCLGQQCDEDEPAPFCEAYDECEVDNGGCGAPSLFTCVDTPEAAPTCEDIDACRENNGGCGDPAFVRCVDQADTPIPVCEDIDSCATENGGCGDRALFECHDQDRAAPICRQLGWVQRFPAHAPEPRKAAAMAYDSHRGVVVLFGGEPEGGDPKLGDTWEWDGEDWTQVFPAESPSPRVDACMGYDAARRQMVIFGGQPGGGAFRETWVYDGGTWAQKEPLTNPWQRGGCAMTYDSRREEVIMFGGSLEGPSADDTWAWNGENWHRITPATVPQPRYVPTVAYDPVRDVSVLFGGNGSGVVYGDTWEFDGTRWTDVSPPTSPDGRYECRGSATDPTSGATLVVAGQGAGVYFADAWLYDGSVWSETTATTGMGQRVTHAISNGPDNTALVFGGTGDGVGPFDDTWEYRFCDLPECVSPPDNPCDVDNGGCGDPERTACVTRNRRVVCVDVDECARDNGGCGQGQCIDQDGAAPVCDDTRMDPIAHWPFSNDSVEDVSGHGHHGVNNGGIFETPGVLTLAAGTYVEVAPDGLSGFDQMTLCAWVKHDPSSAGLLIHKMREGDNEVSTDSYSLGLSAADHVPEFRALATEGQGSPTGPRSVDSASWHHLCGAFDGKHARLYVDSALVAQEPATGAIYTTDAPVMIGGCVWPDCGDQTFVGQIDEMVLWARALRPHEILAEFQKESCVNGRDDNRNWRTDCADDVCAADPACQ